MESAAESKSSVDGETSRSWRLAGEALSFAVGHVAHGLTGLQAVDALLVLAINQANIVLLTRDTEARRAYGSLSAPAPDESRRPVSVHAIATSLALPFETVRRHVGRLEALGVCRHEGRGVIVPSAYLSSPAYLHDVAMSHARLRRLHLEVTTLGLLDPLPASAYAPSDDPPVRAAARLLSDFLLRTADILMRHTQDIASGLALAAVMTASPPLSLPPKPGSRAGLTIAEIARTLGLPPETTRRRMARLVADGHCIRDPRGRHVATVKPGDPVWDSTIAELAAALQRLMAGLSERGVIDSWVAASSVPAGAA